MKVKYLSWLFVPLAAVILSACSSAFAETLNTETSDPNPALQETEEILQDEDDAK